MKVILAYLITGIMGIVVGISLFIAAFILERKALRKGILSGVIAERIVSMYAISIILVTTSILSFIHELLEILMPIISTSCIISVIMLIFVFPPTYFRIEYSA